MIITWKGKNIKDMTKEELVEAITIGFKNFIENEKTQTRFETREIDLKGD